jgi:hypothetical protein
LEALFLIIRLFCLTLALAVMLSYQNEKD